MMMYCASMFFSIVVEVLSVNASDRFRFTFCVFSMMWLFLVSRFVISIYIFGGAIVIV